MLDIIKNRRSIRQYEDKEIPKEKLKEIIEAASYAPSALNSQPWYFIIITDKNKKHQIRQIYDEATEKLLQYQKYPLIGKKIKGIYRQDTSFLEKATLVACCYDKKMPFARDALAMAVENLMLEATANELGSVCIGRATSLKKYKKQIKNLIAIEKNYEVPYIVAVGYTKPLEQRPIPKRKSIEEISRII